MSSACMYSTGHEFSAKSMHPMDQESAALRGPRKKVSVFDVKVTTHVHTLCHMEG
jgi:hypothetical protein